jgi:hypothetical protein
MAATILPDTQHGWLAVPSSVPPLKLFSNLHFCGRLQESWASEDFAVVTWDEKE